ncbi:MAG: polysaccharide deacetylase family protein [Gaiellaceae bacterium]
MAPSAIRLHAAAVREPDVWPERYWRYYRRHGSRKLKEVALTFDDGPGPHTADILELLEAVAAEATFFVVGDHAQGKEGLLRRIVVAGHELGNHSMTHAELMGRPVAAYREIRKTNSLLRHLTGCTPRAFRAPFGAVSRGVVAAARLAGLTTVAWDVDSADWSSPGEDAIAEKVLGGVRGGSIVLLHDGRGPREQTLAALPRIIEGLTEQGYRLVTTSRLLRHSSALASD